jgi:predicted nucleic acid-binding protein
MPDKAVLPDTCAWIDFFNGRATPLADSLAHALNDRDVITCGVVMYELFQGIRTIGEAETLRTAFSSLRYLEMDRELWLSAAHMSASLRGKGITLPFSDIIIAALARRHELVVLTVDHHFDQVPDLLVTDVL